jgi:hypothetical protein
MNQKELKQRMIELLDESFAKQYDKRGLITATHTAEDLIANGVTIRERGEWGLETNEEEPNYMFKLVVCSVCNKKANQAYSFCPHCGADMRGVKDVC